MSEKPNSNPAPAVAPEVKEKAGDKKKKKWTKYFRYLLAAPFALLNMGCAIDDKDEEKEVMVVNTKVYIKAVDYDEYEDEGDNIFNELYAEVLRLEFKGGQRISIPVPAYSAMEFNFEYRMNFQGGGVGEPIIVEPGEPIIFKNPNDQIENEIVVWPVAGSEGEGDEDYDEYNSDDFDDFGEDGDDDSEGGGH